MNKLNLELMNNGFKSKKTTNEDEKSTSYIFKLLDRTNLILGKKRLKKNGFEIWNSFPCHIK